MSSSLAPMLQYFFTEHLVSHKQVSPRTIVTYRDSFRLLLQFLKERTGKKPASLCVDDLDAPAILDFLESLEQQRANQVCSRNVRLTAIRSFFHVVALCAIQPALRWRVVCLPFQENEQTSDWWGI
jgi:integrase/recombinase XerD